MQTTPAKVLLVALTGELYDCVTNRSAAHGVLSPGETDAADTVAPMRLTRCVKRIVRTRSSSGSPDGDWVSYVLDDGATIHGDHVIAVDAALDAHAV